MRDHFRLPLRPASVAGDFKARDGQDRARAGHDAAPHRRNRSRSPDRARAPLRERDVTLLTAVGGSKKELTMNLTHRPKTTTTDENVRAWLGGTKTFGKQLSSGSEDRRPSIAPSEIESDADDITIKTFQAPVAMPMVSMARQREAHDLARKNPTSFLTAGDYMTHRAHLDAITTFWGGCPSRMLAPALIPKKTRSPTAPGGGKYGPLDPVSWEADLVKGLRLLAPLCTANAASFWLLAELRKERGKQDADQDSMTRFTVRAVYKAFLEMGYKPKTLAQAQKENKEKQMLTRRRDDAMPAATNRATSADCPTEPYAPSRSSAEVMAALRRSKTIFKFPWETDAGSS